MSTLFLEAFARPLLILHAVLGGALAGVSIHLALAAVRFWRGAHHFARLIRVYAHTAAALFVTSLAAGLLLYPYYRYQVRALYLDRYETSASALFDLKENAATLAIPLVLALFVGGRKAGTETPPQTRAVIAGTAVGLCAVVSWSVIAGLWVTSVKGP